MICGRYKCACAPRSKPFACNCKKPRKPTQINKYTTVLKCSKCKAQLANTRAGYDSVLEIRIALTEVTPPDVRVPVLKGQKRLF